MQAYTHNVLTVTKEAAEDITRGVIVKLSSGKAAICGAGEKAYGVCLKDVSSGNHAEIMILGVCPVKSGAAITADAVLASDATGRAVAATAGDYPVGRAEFAVSAADRYTSMRVDMGNIVVPS